jgi:hypothetical protein
MPRNLYSRYVWILNTMKRYGAITREDLSDLWMRSRFSDGRPLPRRTFFNYRMAIEEMFNVNIAFNPSTNEYSIEDLDGSEAMTDWLLNSMTVTNVLNDSREVAPLIFFEEVPSAHEFLSSIIAALKERHRVSFTYHSYSRAVPKANIVVEPYFLKIFRQRWYVTGLNVKDNAIKTYALDRMSDLKQLADTYQIPDDFEPAAYFRDSFGIVFNQGQVKDIVLKVDPRQAKYFRALPLHHSQTEMVNDGYSLFSYRLKISDDFVQELLSYGPNITVVKPAELKAIMVNSLRQSLENYGKQVE